MIQHPSQFHVIKSFILDAHQNGLNNIEDNDPSLKILCEAVERCFRLGLRAKKDYYVWLDGIMQLCRSERICIPHGFESAVQTTRTNSSVQSIQGRGRLLIRSLLKNSQLDFPIKFMQSHPIYASKLYETSYSALGNEILIQILCSLVSELCRLPFKLNLANAEFLDQTWEMPVFKQFEFVPCGKLGARLDPVEGHAVVTLLDPNGVAAEDNKIGVGDIIVSMYGKTVRHAHGHIISWRTANEGKPVPVGVSKAYGPDGTVYRPLQRMLQLFGLDHLIPDEKASISSGDTFFEADAKHRLVYIGHCDVGSNGSVQMINRAIVKVLSERSPTDIPIPVHMDLDELGVRVWKVNTKSGQLENPSNPLLRHVFPRIASCGRRTDNTHYLAYIVGPEPSAIDKQFECYVFQAFNRNISKYLVSAIAQGFERTLWTL